MKTLCCLLSFHLAQLHCCGLYAQQVPQAVTGTAARVVEPRTRPPISITQAVAIAERELAARGLAAKYIIKSVTLMRHSRMADCVYYAMLDPIETAGAAPNDPAPANVALQFTIDMRSTVTFREIPVTRVRVQQ